MKVEARREKIKYEVTEAPLRIGDWRGYLVRSKKVLENSYVHLPAGSVLRIEYAHKIKHLRGLPCECCKAVKIISVKNRKEEFLRDFEFIKEVEI